MLRTASSPRRRLRAWPADGPASQLAKLLVLDCGGGHRYRACRQHAAARIRTEYFDPAAAPITELDASWAIEKAMAAFQGEGAALSVAPRNVLVTLREGKA